MKLKIPTDIPFSVHVGAKPVYICSQLVYTVGAILMSLIRHPAAVILLSPCAGIMYATLFTMPYLLVAHYHSNDTVSKSMTGDMGQNSACF